MSAPRAATASRRPRAPRRRPAVPLWRRRTVVAVVLTAAVSGALGGAWGLWRTGWVDRVAGAATQRALGLSARAGFRVDDVLVLGRHETAKADLLRAVGLDRGAPILAFDPALVRARVEKLPWVRRARVERRLPDTILLRIDERQPLAVWQHQGRYRLIGRDGTVITERGLDRFAGLPLVVGAGAPDRAAALVDMLATQPDLARRVRAAVRVGGRRWNLRMANGTDVRLPADDPAAAWARLAEAERRHGLLARDPVVVDLRLPDRLILRLPLAGSDDPPGGRQET
ncbi:MAG: FtsQ-type POTRA domain-containing protein [Hyphomicrobiales bacterium]|nr:FtsQ-type POTRA domain-containing protein [Hyphomicrobiales bacterium]MCP5371216.1 FtsQ-type POTRA domain-containing protein [Hyphomicrobiales bacterium]